MGCVPVSGRIFVNTLETDCLPNLRIRTGVRWLRRLLPGIAGLTAAGFGLYTYARKIETRWLDIHNIALTLPRLAPAFDGYRIVQISDLHMEMWRDWATFDRAIDRINALAPDLIVVTGDYVNETVDDIAADLCRRLARLHAPDGVLSVLGNHDYWRDGEAVQAVVNDAGLRDIRNRVYTLRRDGAALHVAGVDSVVEMRARLDVVLKELPGDGAAILLAHEPDFAFASAVNGRFDLQLSGHSHGGQVRLPLLTELVLPPLARHFIMGYYQWHGMHIYVNRGLGISGLRMRFLCRPEVTVLTLRAPTA